jgi:hypothetical protein
MIPSVVLLILLVLHIAGLIIMAGTTLVDYLTYKTFWKIYALEKKTSTSLNKLMSRFSRLIGIGAAILILTGFAMMYVTHGIFGETSWFRIKFAFVIILVTNGVFVGRRIGSRLRKLTSAAAFEWTDNSRLLKSRLGRFYISQLFIFLVIIFLSVFKFN